jgi:hypothetical protein
MGICKKCVLNRRHNEAIYFGRCSAFGSPVISPLFYCDGG